MMPLLPRYFKIVDTDTGNTVGGLYHSLAEAETRLGLNSDPSLEIIAVTEHGKPMPIDADLRRRLKRRESQ